MNTDSANKRPIRDSRQRSTAGRAMGKDHRRVINRRDGQPPSRPTDPGVGEGLLAPTIRKNDHSRGRRRRVREDDDRRARTHSARARSHRSNGAIPGPADGTRGRAGCPHDGGHGPSRHPSHASYCSSINVRGLDTDHRYCGRRLIIYEWIYPIARLPEDAAWS